jgi:phenylacetate-coenzyme A ligase PaaK-like adenylate-forming protein
VPAEVVFLEVVDDSGAPAPPGSAGQVLLTTLRNRVMPLLRYRIGDLASMAETPCGCGRSLPVVAAIHGRANDLLRAADGSPVPPDAVSRSILAVAAGSVLEFRVVQRRGGRVDVSVVQRETGSADGDRARIAAAALGASRPTSCSVRPSAGRPSACTSCRFTLSVTWSGLLRVLASTATGCGLPTCLPPT